YGSTAWGTYWRQRRRSSPQPSPPMWPRSRRGFQPLVVSYGRSCYLDMKTPPEGGQVSDHTQMGCSGKSVILRPEEGWALRRGIARVARLPPPWPRLDAAA